MEMDPKERIREDNETRPIEENVQSAGVSEEEQVFFTGDDDETETQVRKREKRSCNNPIDKEVVIQIDTMSEKIVDEITSFTQKLRRTNQVLLEQSKDLRLNNYKPKFRTK